MCVGCGTLWQSTFTPEIFFSFILVARIGFSPVVYGASESDGSIMFMFGVLEGNIAFDVNVDFETTDETALGTYDK